LSPACISSATGFVARTVTVHDAAFPAVLVRQAGEVSRRAVRGGLGLPAPLRADNRGFLAARQRGPLVSVGPGSADRPGAAGGSPCGLSPHAGARRPIGRNRTPHDDALTGISAWISAHGAAESPREGVWSHAGLARESRGVAERASDLAIRSGLGHGHSGRHPSRRSHRRVALGSRRQPQRAAGIRRRHHDGVDRLRVRDAGQDADEG
jgi:hypothetical protein